MTAVQRPDSTTPAEAAPPVDAAAAPASMLGELLRAFGREDGIERFQSVVCEVLVRGLRLEGALLRTREDQLLRATAGAGLGVDLAALPPVAPDLHPWPDGDGPMLLPAEAVARLLPALPVRWRTVHLLPLRAAGALRGALYLSGGSMQALGAEQAEEPRVLADAHRVTTGAARARR